MRLGQLAVAAALGWVVGASSAAGQPLALTLAEAQERAMAGNRMLEVARAGVDEASARRLQSWAGHLPQVSVTEQVVRTNNALSSFGFLLRQERVAAPDFAPAALNDPAAITNYQTVLEVRQPLYNGGQALSGRRQAVAGERAAHAQLQRARQEVRLHTARAYWGVVLANQGLGAVRQALATARAHAAAAEARYDEDTAPLSDLLAAQVRVAELRGQEVDALDQVARAGDGLSLVVGLPRQTSVQPADTLTYRELARELAELVQVAGRSRADLQAAAHQTAAAQHAVGVARAAYLPHLNAFAQADLDADGLLDRQGESWTVGAMVTWQVFDGLQGVGRTRQAQAQVRQRAARAEFLRAEAERQVAAAWRQVRSAQTQVEIADEAVAQAAERLRMTELQYREDLVTAPDLLDAETALTQARLRRLGALHALNVGMAELEFAVGEPL